MMILVTGGSGSGKSAFAENCVRSLAPPFPTKAQGFRGDPI